MKFTMIALALLLAAPAFATPAKPVYGSGETTRNVRQGDFNCNRPIVAGGTRYCPSGAWVKPGKAALADDPTFSTGGGSNGE